MKNFHLLLIVVSICVLNIGCGKDDDNPNSNVEPSFSCTFEWQDALTSLVDVSTLVTNVDITWEEGTDFSSYADDESDVPEGALWFLDDTEDPPYFQVIGADIVDGDTTLIGFLIYADELEEKKYNYASLDLLSDILGGIFGEDVMAEIEQGVAIPLILVPGPVGEELAFVSFFASSDYGSSFFEITEYDKINNEISGNFTLDWSVVNEENGVETTVNLLKINDGEFNRVEMINL